MPANFFRCKKCLYPSTKPDLQFDAQGNCSACNFFSNRPQTNWDKRYQELLKIVEKYKEQYTRMVGDGNRSKCVILPIRKLFDVETN